MTRPQRRIFVYKPQSPGSPEPPEQRAPEPDPEPDGPDETDILRAWLLTPGGAAVVWLMAFIVLLPAAGMILLLFPEEYGQLLVGFGLWVVLGLAVIHWWLPPGDESSPHAEGIAVAGWHVLVTTVLTSFFAWFLLAPDAGRPAFSFSETFPVIIVGGILLVMFGIILTLLRGHVPGRGLRYAWTMLCMLAVWMSLWLVAAHSGF